MSRRDLDDFEVDVRTELHRQIVPPAPPRFLRQRIEAEAAAAQARKSSPRTGRSRTFGLVLGAAAVVALVGVLLLNAARQSPPALSPSFSPVDSWSPGQVGVMDQTPDGGAFVYVDGTGLLVTDDFGATWSAPRKLPSSDSVRDRLWDVGTIDFVDSQHGWMTRVTNGPSGSEVTEFRTDDAARSWTSSKVTALPPAAGAYDPELFVGAQQHFLDPNTGWLVLARLGGLTISDCTIRRTSDGGRTWSNPTAWLNSADNSCPGLTPAVTWQTDLLGYAFEPRTTDWPDEKPARIDVTEDGGRTWHQGALPDSWMDALPMLLTSNGFGHLEAVVSHSASEQQAVFESTDSGDSWVETHALTMPAGVASFDSITAVGSGQLIAVADIADTSPSCLADGSCVPIYEMGLFTSSDLGRSWQSVQSSGLSPGNAPSPRLAWWDEKHGLTIVRPITGCSATGAAASSCGWSGSVLVTADGGRTWRAVNL